MNKHIQALIFRLDPERAHNLVLGLLRMSGSIFPLRLFIEKIFQPQHSTAVELMGLQFSNPVGLAAGYDKDGTSWRGLAGLGFGHLELGTVTPLAQAGNPKPRIFRIPEQQALINRMGFPGKGAEFVAHQLQTNPSSRLRRKIILGLNIGKNKDTPNHLAVHDYVHLVRQFHQNVDYFAVNVSSPNTIGLRQLQTKKILEDLVRRVIQERDYLVEESGKNIPLVVKLSPDLTDHQLDDALDAILSGGADGVIATNTSLSREGVLGPLAQQEGGLSGSPLRDLSTKMIRKISKRTNGKLPIIGVGGIDSVDAAKEKLSAGADLIQIYTGLIYQGPGFVRKLVEEL